MHVNNTIVLTITYFVGQSGPLFIVKSGAMYYKWPEYTIIYLVLRIKIKIN